VPIHVVLEWPDGLPGAVIDDHRAAARALAEAVDDSVTLWRLDGRPLDGVLAALAASCPPERREEMTPGSADDRAAPMGAAPFRWRADGRPDWRAMWSAFCELALFGGPPHRGPDSPIQAGARSEGAPDPPLDAIAEIRRGIWETTGLYAEPAEPGWLAVSCDSRRMAAWLCATIILENVDARAEEERLLVPAHPSYVLEDQVKSVITVVAKTVHYWAAHVDGPGSPGQVEQT
jgi:hypothetical protein